MIKINHASETIQFDRIENRSVTDKAEKKLCYGTTNLVVKIESLISLDWDGGFQNFLEDDHN